MIKESLSEINVFLLVSKLFHGNDSVICRTFRISLLQVDLGFCWSFCHVTSDVTLKNCVAGATSISKLYSIALDTCKYSSST